jgi:hypothetical protein
VKISEFSVKHPVIISIILLVLAVFGVYSVAGQPAEFMVDISMPQAGEGVYQLKAYLTARIGTSSITSEAIYRDLIWRDENSDEIILGSPYRGRTVSAIQYETLSIPYSVAGNANTYEVKYFVDDMDNPVDTITLANTAGGTWNYKPLTVATHNLKI